MPAFSGHTWPSLDGVAVIRWSFAEQNYPELAQTFADYDLFDSPIAAQYRNTIRAAFLTWQAVSGVRFVEVADGASVPLRVGNLAIDGRATETSGSILAQTATWFIGSVLNEAQIVFDNDVYDDPLDLFSVAVHEIGHALGLDHSDSTYAVMYGTLNYDNELGYLDIDDLIGIATLYGSRDDYAANAQTAGRIAVGSSVRGTVETLGDKDWFAATFTAGRSYRIDLAAYDSDEGSLVDPFLTIYSAAGAVLASDDDSGPGLESRNIFTPDRDGTYFLAAGAYDDPEYADQGSYRLSIVDITTGAAGATALRTAAGNILRTSTGAATADLAQRVTTGALTFSAAAAELVRAAASTTSVATLSYEFFTGRVPSSGGMDFLVSPTGPNPNNLNSAYFQGFSLENRYINFAVNLGKAGEGAAAFSARYGSLSLFEATRQAYATIFGSAPSDAKLHAILDPSFQLGGQTLTRTDYFALYGGDGAGGIGTKAAMVGYLLAEAVKADLGVYAKVNDAFLADLVDGASFGVDIVGAYNKPEYIFVSG